MKSQTAVVSVSDRQLSAELARLIKASKSANTQRAYESALIDFDAFCSDRGTSSIPATPKTVADYLEWLSGHNRVSTMQVKVSAIRFAHRLKKYPDPTDDELVRAVMAGLRRDKGTAPSRKTPVTRDRLIKMLDANGNNLTATRNRAILLLGFAGAFRRSELVALDVADVAFDDSQMAVRLRRSKTDQEGRGRNKVIPAIEDMELCPVRAMMHWLNASGLTSGPLFRKVTRWQKPTARRLCDRTIALIVKQSARAAGMDEIQFSGHSLRSGFVTQAARERTPEWQIQEVTGHKSTTVLRGYIRDEGLGQVDAIRRVFGETEQD